MIVSFPIQAPAGMRHAQPDSRVPFVRDAVRQHCELHCMSATDTTAAINQAIAQLTNGMSGPNAIVAGKDHANRLRRTA